MYSPNVSLREEKKALRKLIKEKLATIPLEDVMDQSSKITAEVLGLPAYIEAKRISVFLSMPAREVSTHDIVVHAITHGKSVFVPYLSRNQNSQKSTSMMDMLALHSKEDLESLRPDAWGIPTLDEDSVAGRENALSAHRIGNSVTTDQCPSSGPEVRGLDLILVPGVAFDTRNGRLGHGKGFYDRYLQRYKDIVSSGGNSRMPRLIGLALKEQMLPTGTVVPRSNDDWAMDEVITGA